MSTVKLLYSCDLCGLVDVPVYVRARTGDDEDVVEWLNGAVLGIAQDHRRRSPTCLAEKITAIKIPAMGIKRIGGPVES